MATRTWRGTTTGNYNLAGNWLEGAIPTSADDVLFDGTFTNHLVVNVASVCKTVNFTNYTGTVTMTNNLSVSGAITLSIGMGTISGTGALIGLSTATHTSNGKTWGAGFSLQSGGVTHTLADNWTVSGSISLGTSNVTTTVNGFSLTTNASCTLNGNAVINGTTHLKLGGTGNLTSNATNNSLNLTLTILSTATITLVNTGGFTFKKGGTTDFTIQSGAVLNGTGVTFTFLGTSNNVSGNGVSIPWNVTFSHSGTVTILSDIIIFGTTTFGLTNFTSTINGFKIYAKGDVALGTGNSTVNGTTELVICTTTIQTVSMGSGSTTSQFRNNLSFNASGTVNLSGIIYYNTGMMTYTAGSVNVGTSTLWIQSNGTTELDTNGITWYNVQIHASSTSSTVTVTLRSTLYVSNFLTLGTLLFSPTITFNGSAGFNVQKLTSTPASTTSTNTITMEAGNIYRVQNDMTCTGTNLGRVRFASSVPGTWTYFFLANGATQSNAYTNGTDVNSALGQTIWSFGASLVNTVNWNVLGTPQSIAHAYVV